MGRPVRKTFNGTIAEYVHSQIVKHARLTGLVLFLVSLTVFIASIKFATDRHVRGTCAKVNDSARILVETSQIESYQPYFDEVALKLKRDLQLDSLEVMKGLPPASWHQYSLGACSINWRSDLKVGFFSPTHWAGETVYVRAIITPRLIRSDLILFMIAVCLVLFASYYFGARSFLRNIDKKISEPIHGIWEWLSTGKKPSDLDIKEISNLWQSLVEYKELLTLRNRMLLAKEYYHEVKAPAFYQYNQLKWLTTIEDPSKQKAIIADTLAKAEDLIQQMEKALKKIATDDYGRHPKTINFAELVRQSDRKYIAQDPVNIVGDKTLIKTMLNNLYANALDACGDTRLVETTLAVESEHVVLTIKNPVPKGTSIDTEAIFVSGFTSKIGGTGLGLPLCQHIAELHKGLIRAEFSSEAGSFKVIAVFPKDKEDHDAKARQDIVLS